MDKTGADDTRAKNPKENVDGLAGSGMVSLVGCGCGAGRVRSPRAGDPER